MNIITEQVFVPTEALPLIGNIVIGNRLLKDTVFFDRALGIIYFIHERECIMKEDGVGISRDNFRKVFKDPANTATIKNALLDANIIKYHSQKYSTGRFSKSYTLGFALDGISWSRHMEMFLPILRNNYAGSLDFLSIDKEKALEILATIPLSERSRSVFTSQIKHFHTKYTVGKTDRQFGVWNRIPSQCRRALLIYNEITCELDIINCQPLLLAGLSGDKAFIKITEAGRFYEQLSAYFNLDRRVAKGLFLQWLGGHKKTGLDDFMNKNYPIAANFRRDLENVKSGDLIRLLQKTEASLILPICAETNSASIHDGLRTTLSNKDKVYPLIYDSFAAIGVRPEVKLELS